MPSALIRKRFLRADLAGQVDELLGFARQPLHRRRLVQLRQHRLELARRFGRVDHLPRIGVDGEGRQRDRQHLAVAVGDHGAAGVQQRLAGRIGAGRRRLGRAHDLLGQLRQPRLDDGGICKLDHQRQEQHREAGGREQQPSAHAVEGGAALEVGRRDPHVLHARQHGSARRAEPAGRAGGGGGVRRIAHCVTDCWLPPGCQMEGALTGVTAAGAPIERAMPSAEATAGLAASLRAMWVTGSPALPAGGVVLALARAALCAGGLAGSGRAGGGAGGRDTAAICTDAAVAGTPAVAATRSATPGVAPAAPARHAPAPPGHAPRRPRPAALAARRPVLPGVARAQPAGPAPAQAAVRAQAWPAGQVPRRPRRVPVGTPALLPAKQLRPPAERRQPAGPCPALPPASARAVLPSVPPAPAAALRWPARPAAAGACPARPRW